MFFLAVDKLFPTGVTTCTAYAIVNAPAGMVLPDVAADTDTKMATIKAMSVSADFTGTPASFVMDGAATVIYSTATETASGTIPLERAASKITLFVKAPEDYTDDAGNLWKAQITDFPMDVRFYSGVNTSCINPGGGKNTTITENSYFDIKGDSKRTLVSTADGYTHSLPFYSYPSDWGRADLPDREVYMLLCIYWQKVQDKDGNDISASNPAEAYYYRVPVNLNGAEDAEGNVTHKALQLSRNTYYKATIEVGVLGDKDLNSEIVLTPTYIMVPWKTENIDATMSDFHYLVVSDNYIELFNEETATFSFTSCDENVDVKIVSVTQKNYANVAVSTTTYYDSSTGTDKVEAGINDLLRTLSLVKNGNQVVLTHELVNDISTLAGFDAAPYTIIVRLTTKCGLTSEVEIVQYSANYIEANYTKQNTNLDGKNNRGTVYINGNKGPTNSWDHVSNIEPSEKDDDNNSNPNSYVITVTSFSEDDLEKYPYIIGDPRDRNAGNGQGYSATTLKEVLGSSRTMKADGSGNTLQHYYPTLGSTIDYNNLDKTSQWQYLIAPKFRVVTAYASLSGGGSLSNKDDAVMRCAAYQEYGRPAGRWRVPTPAELTYILTLVENGKINSIIYGGSTYYSSFGGLNTGTGAFQTTANSVRCVYDEWYWGDDTCPIDEFTWGDEVIN